MSFHRVVVDGSNIATEGRSLPSLVQLDEAVRAYREEHPDAEIIVVVDATFAHRIHESEREMFEEAAAHNELVYPPAGAIGRGDAFLLRIADKTDAVVLSNDSFQEFHGEFDWLFTKGRLIGGTPVPSVGWIFVPRTPVRGPKSRESVKEAKRGKVRIGSKDASLPMPVPKAPPPRSPKNKDVKGGDSSRPSSPAKDRRLKAAIEEATEEAVAPDAVDGGGGGNGGGGGKGGRKRRRRKGKGAAAVAAVALPTVNEPLTFIQFIADHQPGASVQGEVESFASHGAFVLVGDARCYVPLSAMGEPPPRSAREILNRGETRTFVVQALDAPRRGIELALPGFERVAGRPTEETVDAEIGEAPPPIHAAASPVDRAKSRKAKAAKPSAPTKPRKGAAAAKSAKSAKSAKKTRVTGVPPAARAIPAIPEAPQERPLEPPPKKAAAAKKAAAKAPKKAAAKKAVTKKGAAKKVAPTPEKAAKKAATTKGAAKVPTKKAAATPKKTPATKAATKKASANRGAATPRKAAPKKASAKTAAPQKKAATPEKTSAKKATKRATKT